MTITTTGHQCLKPVLYHNLVLDIPCHIRYLATDRDGETYGFIGNRPFFNPIKGTWYNPKTTPQFIDTNGAIPTVAAECSCQLVVSKV